MGDVANSLDNSVLDLNFVRPGSLQLTSRFSNNEDPAWEDEVDRAIEISLGLVKIPLRLIVRKFVPSPHDSTSRNWIAPDGYTRVVTRLEPYDVVDTNAAVGIIDAYILANCHCFDEVVAQAHQTIRAVYERVAGHLADLRAAAAASRADDDREMLTLVDLYCPLWFGIRNTMGSAWLVGKETLGMEPCFDDGYPLYGKISVPRAVVQTVGCLLSRLNSSRQTEFLEALRKAIAPTRGVGWGQRAFYTIFLVVFMLLHECEDISKDRERYARQNHMKERFSLPKYVEALHKSARDLVNHWLAFAEHVGVDFTSQSKLEDSLMFLEAPKRNLVVACYKALVTETYPIRACRTTWHMDTCFVTHMFGVEWADEALYYGT